VFPSESVTMPRYFYSLLSFDESLPEPVRAAAEELAKARALSPDPRARFDILENNLRIALQRAALEKK
jgi:hypothetical protein